MQDPSPTVARLDISIDSFWSRVETGIYVAVAVVITIAALIALGACGVALWHGLGTMNSLDTLLQLIDELLLVLMLVEILHTVRISIRSHELVAEPFLLVGLIATIRRMLVLGLTVENLSRLEGWNASRQALLHESVLELGLLGLLVLVLVIAIYMLRRAQAV